MFSHHKFYLTLVAFTRRVLALICTSVYTTLGSLQGYLLNTSGMYYTKWALWWGTLWRTLRKWCFLVMPFCDRTQKIAANCSLPTSCLIVKAIHYTQLFTLIGWLAQFLLKSHFLFKIKCKKSLRGKPWNGMKMFLEKSTAYGIVWTAGL